MKKITVAQIGTSLNSHGNDIFDSLKRQNTIFDIAGFALPENEREKFPERMKSFEGYKELTVEEILDDPNIEAVFIEGEEIFLSKYALMAAKAKKHIHMEKPGGTALSLFEELIETAKKNSLIFHIGYMYRYNPEIENLLSIVRAGKLGKILSVEAQMNCCHQSQTRQWLENFPGGIMFFLGCHLIDLILQLQGQPKKILPLNKATGVDGVTAEDFGFAVLEYENGVSFAKINSTEIGGYARRQLVVSGTKGTVELKPLEMYIGDMSPDLYTATTEYSSPQWGDMGISRKTQAYNRYDKMLSSFAAMVRGDIENPYSYDYELNLYKAVLRSCGVEV